MSRQVYSEQYQAFLTRLRDARKRAGMSQGEVGTRLGKPQSFVSKCEAGDRRVDVIEAREFASIYGITLEELIGDEAGGEG